MDLSSPHSPRCFYIEVSTFSKVLVYFYAKYVRCSKRLGSTKGYSRTTRRVEDERVLINEHTEEVTQYWLGLRGHMAGTVGRSCVSITDTTNNLTIASRSKETGLVD